MNILLLGSLLKGLLINPKEMYEHIHTCPLLKLGGALLLSLVSAYLSEVNQPTSYVGSQPSLVRGLKELESVESLKGSHGAPINGIMHFYDSP